MKHLLKKLSIALFAVVLLSCEEENKVKPVVEVPKVNLVATLSGANETIPNASKETGSAMLNYNTDTKRFTIVVTSTVGNVDSEQKATTRPITIARIHKGAQGADGPVVFTFGKLISPITFVSERLKTTLVSEKVTIDQEADLLAGLYYVELYTADFPGTEKLPGGEIRGNLVKK